MVAVAETSSVVAAEAVVTTVMGVAEPMVDWLDEQGR